MVDVFSLRQQRLGVSRPYLREKTMTDTLFRSGLATLP